MNFQFVGKSRRTQTLGVIGNAIAARKIQRITKIHQTNQIFTLIL
jgi:hypothetical protein